MAANPAGPLAPLRAVLDSFWICRVSIFSVLSGWLLLYGAPQTQALFLDMHTPEVGRWHWAGFYLAALLFWMLPTQLSARVMLHAGADRFEEGHSASYAKFIVHLPWVLALACLVGIAAGQFAAFDHIPGEADRAGRPLEEAVHAQLVILCCTTVALIGLWLLFWLLLPRGIHRLTVSSGLLDIWLLRVVAMAMFGRRATTRDTGPQAARPEVDDGARFTPEQLQTAWAAITLFGIWCLSSGVPLPARHRPRAEPGPHAPGVRRCVASRAHFLRLFRPPISPAASGWVPPGLDAAGQCDTGPEPARNARSDPGRAS